MPRVGRLQMKEKTGEKTKKRHTRALTVGKIVAVILATVSVLWCFSMRWMLATWANLSMDELVYHMTTTLEGTSTATIISYCVNCAVPAVIALAGMIVLLFVCKKRRLHRWVVGVGIIGAIAGAAAVTWHVWTTLDVGSYLSDQSTYSSFIDENYVDPADVEITFPEEKRNLIYIFLESMEVTYADQESGGAFSENVIPELTEIGLANETFSGTDSILNGAYVTTGAGWTIGAIFAQTSGLPLKVSSIGGNNMDTQDSFYAGATVLGDILADAGYSQTFLLGSDATFGGRRLYFSEHGSYTIKDYNYAVETGPIDEDYYVWWGYEDEKLFEYAKEELLELSQQDEPFNLTMLTVDMHFEDGYVCDLCDDTFGDDQYANVMACSSRQLAGFLEWIQEQDFYENTTIVLAGDHLTMDSDFCEDIDGEYNRKTYTVYINAAVESETDEYRTYTTLDNFPTTLAALGVNIEGNRLGLGTNLFSSLQTFVEEMGYDEFNTELSKSSYLMEELADIDTSKDALLSRQVTITVGEFETEDGILPLTVTGLSGVTSNLKSVQAAVWTEEDQSDLQWFDLLEGEDGNYYLNLDVSLFGSKSGEYSIAVYISDETRDSELVNTVTGTVP